MPRNGAGNYSLVSGNPVTTGTIISSTTHNNTLADIATALTESLAKDGQTAMTGNLPMAGNKVTGLGNATETGDALTFAQLFSQGQQQDIASAATTDIGAPLTTLLNVTGTATITSFGTNYNGPRFLRFADVCTLTNSATLVLPGGANITTAAGDSLIAVPLGNPATGWRVAVYERADGTILSNAYALLSGATFTGNVNVPSLNGGQLAGFRNLLINGNFQINQRGYASGTNVGAANTYTLDRWRVVTSGENVTFSASGNGNQITAPAGGIEQVIEGINIGGGTYVLNWTGTATATVNGTARAKGESFTLPANTNATVRLIGGTASQVQLEPGTVPTPFEHRPIGAELALCQRYYERIGFRVDTATSSAADFGSVTLRFASEKRATPTITRSAENVSNTSFNSSTARSSSVTMIYNTTATAGIATGTVVADSEL